MKLPELIPLLEIMNFSGPSNIDITGVTCDSRKVKHGDIFVSIKGLKTDGHLFASDAVKNGAVVVVVENWLDLPVGIARIQVENSRKTLS
ncbi:MAG: Mur ligase domain-containing protein, partial [Candidatus Subteraquimicrobiales bacterium]|nr:Mur ligase domain-containing protein [Candidatus Subteraquimicrobiales bacterium]